MFVVFIASKWERKRTNNRDANQYNSRVLRNGQLLLTVPEAVEGGCMFSSFMSTSPSLSASPGLLPAYGWWRAPL